MDIHKAFKQLNKNLLTPKFLERVEKWARYDGEKFDIGDIDVVVENMGTFTITTESPKISTSGGKLSVSKNEMEKHTKVYDVTKIRNNAVCSDYDKRILIAERLPSWMDDDYKASRPAKLFIYAICENSNKKESDEFPSFKTLKSDFESKKYTHYRSLIQEKYDDYELVPFNENTDRIYNFTSIENDLNWLETDKDSLELSKHIEVSPRLSEKKRKEAGERSMNKLLNRK